MGLPGSARRLDQHLGPQVRPRVPGVGWIVWGTEEGLPDELVFHVNYLGGDMPTFALNFSRPGSQVVAQYYNFVRLGREGYTAVQQAARDAAMRLSAEIEHGPSSG